MASVKEEKEWEELIKTLEAENRYVCAIFLHEKRPTIQ